MNFVEMHSHWHELPMVRCPHCGHEFQWDEYYFLVPGSHTECGECEREIYVAETYTAMHVRLSTVEEDC